MGLRSSEFRLGARGSSLSCGDVGKLGSWFMAGRAPSLDLAPASGSLDDEQPGCEHAHGAGPVNSTIL